MPNYAKPKLLDLCLKYDDIFALKTDRMTLNNFYEQKLRLTDTNPVYIKNYRLPYCQREEINKQVDNLLQNDLIEHSYSNYNSPLILVPKKNPNGQKSYRMCVDFRAVNKKLIADKFPLARIDDILDNLGRAKYFSTMDLYSGFHQIPLNKDSRDITSFSTDRGAFRWKVLPFGLNVAPNSFSRMMSIAFSGISPNQAFLYVDDLIVIGCSEAHHLKNLEQVFQTCKKFNLRLNPEKCNFMRSEVTFLGHKCSSKGLLPDDSKIIAIKKYPKPCDKDAVRRFVAFANYYRRFIPNFASIAAPLNKLSRKRVEFKWDQSCDIAFEKLRKSLISPQILQYPDFKKEFIITVDASKIGCGAILSQNKDGIDLPICFASKSFNNSEQKKSIIELELLAIFFAIKQFRPYIYGTHFTVKSDHRPLVYLFNMKDPSSKLSRIRLELAEYNFTIEYIKGKTNVGADALSRITIEEIKNSGTSILAVQTRSQTKQKQLMQQEILKEEKVKENIKLQVYDNFSNKFSKKIPRVKSQINYDKSGKITNFELNAHLKHKKIELIKVACANKIIHLDELLLKLQKEAGKRNINIIELQKNDNLFKYFSISDLKTTGNKILKHLEIVLTEPVETVTDEDKKQQLITIYHTDPILGGHFGSKKVYAKLRTKYYWKGMTRDIAKFVKNCEKCLLNKVKPKTKENLVLTETPCKPFDIVVIDTIGPLPQSDNGNKFAVTIICDLSKYLVTIAIPDKSAKTVASAIFENFILIYGIMKTIKTDLGTEYKNEIFSELTKLLKIEHKFSTAYHHETLGTVERNHRVFNEYLRSFLNPNFSDWDVYLKYFTFLHNTTTNTVFDNKFSPYELVFGKAANLPKELQTDKIDPIYNIENYSKEVKFRFQKTHELANKTVTEHKLKNQTGYNKSSQPISVKVFDKVLLEKEPRDKHSSIYIGPYTVIGIDGVNVTLIDDETKKKKIVHKNRIRKIN
ncbi:retrovirus-related Pol polyprotein from transposon 412 isoform X3 [Eurosta solidaginis]|uniref:retrovirus-related Pol polyprotein from transposon 412 isoform X3 n=1 Tax=Eurosta solidaginis TaxID=178769 RepID=UPI003530CF4D